jgi:hypothetical protein
MTGTTPPGFQVVYSQSVKQAIWAMSQRANAAGRGADNLAALRAIDRRLHSDPRSFGDVRFHYHGLHLEYRVAIVTPLIVHFTVHHTQPVLFVMRIFPLTGQGF